MVIASAPAIPPSAARASDTSASVRTRTPRFRGVRCVREAILRWSLTCAAIRQEGRAAPKSAFCSTSQRHPPCPDVPQKIFRFRFIRIRDCLSPSRLDQRGASRSSRTLRRDAVGVSVRSVIICADERIRCAGEIVWSWPPDAEVTLAVMIRRSRGQESPVPGESTYKPSNHRAGNAGMSRLNLWYLPSAFFSQAGHGCGQRPAFPAPSVFRRAVHQQGSDATRAARR